MNDGVLVCELITDEFLVSELADITGLTEDQVLERLVRDIADCYPKVYCAARLECIGCENYDICTMLEVRK